MAKQPEKSREIHLQLTCLRPAEPPEDVLESEFGLQDRQQALLPGKLVDNGSLVYEIVVVALQQQAGEMVRFKSPYVHGTPDVPFLYISLRRLEFGSAAWVRRLKVPLPRLRWEQLEAAPEGLSFAAAISGEGSGTVPLLGTGWTQQPL